MSAMKWMRETLLVLGFIFSLGSVHSSPELMRQGVAAYQRGDLKEAARFFEEASKSYIATVGERHPDTLTSMANLAFMYGQLGRSAEQLALSEKVVKLRIEVSNLLGHKTYAGYALEETMAKTPARVRDIGHVDDDERILDAGPETVERLCRAMGNSKTLIWNGPLGVFEMPPFDKGTMAAARHAAELARAGKLVAVAGGGDTVAALNAAGVTGDFTFVSTAGGAFLEWMEGKVLPGVAALSQ